MHTQRWSMAIERKRLYEGGNAATIGLGRDGEVRGRSGAGGRCVQIHGNQICKSIFEQIDLPFPCWTESNRPLRTSRWCWRRRSIWCCDACCFSFLISLFLSVSLYLFYTFFGLLDSNCYGRFPCGWCCYCYCCVCCNYIIFIDDVVFHYVKQKAFIQSLFAHSTNTNMQTHIHSHSKHTYTHSHTWINST